MAWWPLDSWIEEIKKKMSHYDIDIKCKICGEYLYSVFELDEITYKLCKTCQKEYDKKKLSPLEYTFKYGWNYNKGEVV